MKYKDIPAALHNHGHSFISLMNYRDGMYVIDMVAELLRELPQEELRISFVQGTLMPEWNYPAVLLSSVADFSSRFGGHLASHQIDRTTVVEATLVIRSARDGGITAKVLAKDDRGREYDVPVAA